LYGSGVLGIDEEQDQKGEGEVHVVQKGGGERERKALR
jgi:hypothetical protein